MKQEDIDLWWEFNNKHIEQGDPFDVFNYCEREDTLLTHMFSKQEESYSPREVVLPSKERFFESKLKSKNRSERDIGLAWEWFNSYLTLKEIGDKYGLTRERVRQIIDRLGLNGIQERYKELVYHHAMTSGGLAIKIVNMVMSCKYSASQVILAYKTHVKSLYGQAEASLTPLGYYSGVCVSDLFKMRNDIIMAIPCDCGLLSYDFETRARGVISFAKCVKCKTESTREVKRLYFINNRHKFGLHPPSKVNNSRMKYMYKFDPEFQTRVTLRSLFRRVLHDDCKGKSTREIEGILGYTRVQLKDHLESMFTCGMNWNNRSEWHIDHIVPISWFVKQGITDPSIVHSLCNLRPLIAQENLQKNAKLTDESISLIMSGRLGEEVITRYLESMK